MKTSKFFFSTLIAAAAMTATAYAELDSAYGTLEWTDVPDYAGDFWSGGYELTFSFTDGLIKTLDEDASYVLAAYWGNDSDNNYGANAVVLKYTAASRSWTLQVGRGALTNEDFDASTDFRFQDSVTFKETISAGTIYTLSVVGGNQAMTPMLTWNGETESLSSYNGNMNGSSNPINYAMLSLARDFTWSGGESGNWGDASWTGESVGGLEVGSFSNVTFNSSVTLTVDEAVRANFVTVAAGATLKLDGEGAISANSLNSSGVASVNIDATLGKVIVNSGASVNISGTTAITGRAEVSGVLNVLAGGALTSSGLVIDSKASVNISGLAEVTGNADFDGTLNVLAGGVLTLSGHDALGYANGLDAGILTAKGSASSGLSDAKIAKIVIADVTNNAATSLTLSKEIQLKGNAELASSGGSTFNTFNGKISAEGINNIVSSDFQLRRAFTIDVAEKGQLSLTGRISKHGDGNDGFTKAGSGTLTISGDNTYDCTTTVSAGTLVANHENALGKGGVSVANQAYLALGTDVTIQGNLSGEGTVILAEGVKNAVLTLNSNSDQRFDGGFSNGKDSTLSNGYSIGLIKAGTGELALTGSSYFGGGNVSVNAGTLYAAKPGSLSGANVSVAAGAKLKVSPDWMGVYAGSVEFAEGAQLLVDLAYLTSPVNVDESTEIAVNVIVASSIKFGDYTLEAGESITLPDGYVTFANAGAFTEYAKIWSYSNNVLSLTLAIPEPSLFGVLSGLGALALVGTRRRRKKA